MFDLQKLKENKIKINIDLAIFPSHNAIGWIVDEPQFARKTR